MKKRHCLLILILILISHQSLSAQNKALSKWTVSDVVNQESAGDLSFSPDGNSLVWVKTRPDKEKDAYVSDLYLSRLDVQEPDNGTFKTIQLTRSNESDRDPLFSRDGETIYFLSSRKEGKKLWALSIYGGEPYEVHGFDSGISDIQWLDENRLAFRSDEGKTLYEKELEEAKDNTIVVEDTAHFKASRIYSFNIKTKAVKRLTDNEFPVSEYAISPNGRYLVSSHIMSPDYAADANPKPTYYLWKLETGEKTQILENGYQTTGEFEFTEDNRGFYFVSVLSSDPEWNGAGISLLHYYDLNTNEVRDVPIDWDWGLGSGFDLVGNDLFVGLANGTTVKLAFLEKTTSGWNKKEVEAGSMQDHITVVATGKDKQTLAYVYSTASTPPQYRIAEFSNQGDKVRIPAGQELFKINEHFEQKKIAKTEVVSWTGALDDEITGILYYPHNYQEGRAYPLVVTIHGGPASQDTDSWNESWTDFNNIMAQKGAFILMPNYHGSGNHGLEFVESIKGHYYEYEVPDVIAGIDMLVDKGMVDRDSLGVKGWSNGAIITTKLTIEYPDLFKVAAPGAGDVNWTSDYGTCSFGVSFDQSYFGGAPWDNTDGKIYNTTYIQKSPLFEMEKVRTPTLIHHGSEDRAVPRDQGWEYYRALQQIGEAPVRFLWYPGQPHGLQKLTHRSRKMEEEIRWFDRYLFGTYDPENEAFKEDSPLAELLKKGEVSTSGLLYGLRFNGLLIPETVLLKSDSIAIGRFEVTNAQYAEFDKEHSYPSLNANHPVSGISLQQARNYATWLSEQTGDTYRLPNLEESEKLQEEAKKVAAKENTLNYWAGYDITIDEVPELRKKMEELQHSLIKEAGVFKAHEIEEALLYDLGGNVAEYNASGNTYGYSAISLVDERGIAQSPPRAYIGFRLIKE